MANKDQLLRLWDQLAEPQRLSLLDYAAFLQQRDLEQSSAPTQPELPKVITAEPGESVIAAIKRLRASYFMLNTDQMLNETSSFMAQFMLQGRPAAEVIPDLEAMFEKHYQTYCESFS